MRICRVCRSLKSPDDFHRDCRKPDGLSAVCKACNKAKTYKWREANADKWRAYQRGRYVAHPVCPAVAIFMVGVSGDRLRARRARKEKTEAVRLYRSRYKAANKDRARELKRKPSRRAARAKQVRERRKRDHAFNLRNRVSAAIHQCLRSGKQGRSWTEFLPYTLADLVAHLERQFLPGMGWHNMGEWHVDHILPISQFNIVDIGDADFMACWAITNLRPLWAADNISKKDKREFLL